MNKEQLRDTMRIIEDFPAKGISFKDITTVLQDPEAFHSMVDVLAEELQDVEYDAIIGVEARGFIVGAPVAYAMNKGFLMARKPGKLPGNLLTQNYALEYGEAEVQLDRDSVQKGQRIVVLDDLLATGGTALATCQLVERAGGEVAQVVFLTELEDLGGRTKLEEAGYTVKSILHWKH